MKRAGGWNKGLRKPLDQYYSIDDSGCWLFKSAKDGDGYGLMSGSRKAHRVFYQQYKGEIPYGLCVCHSCDVRHCVNPEHLFIATNQENTMDRYKKGRSAKGEKNGASKLTKEQALEAKISPDSGRSLARKFGVTPRVISLIRRGMMWRDVIPDPDRHLRTR